MTAVLAIGTKNGLWLAKSDDSRTRWDVTGPHHPMNDVYAVGFDTRRPTPRLFAGITSEHYGPSLAFSDDLGATWQEPDHAPIAFPTDTETALTRVWQFAFGPPAVVYAGVQPSALFRSTDGGASFELVRGLWDHPHRPEWTPGYGGQAIHSIVPHPTDPARVTVAMSTGGVYVTTDGGESWRARNAGIHARYRPDPYPEFGQCVHKIAQHPDRPERFYAQVHHGVYRSDDGAESWQSIAEGLPSDFGFPMVVHPRRPDVIYNFPLTADADRFPPQGRCTVYRSEDAGKSWDPLTSGLPTNFWNGVLRDAMCVDTGDPAGVYLGTRSGSVYASRDEGEHWQPVVDQLPDVLCVRAVLA